MILFFFAVYLVALVGVTYRFYQFVTGELRTRLESINGFGQLSGAIGATLIWVNIPILAHTSYVAYVTISGRPDVSGIMIVFVLGFCGASYILMELLLLPITSLRADSSTPTTQKGND